MSDQLPLDIIFDIVRRVARDDFMYIEFFLKAGPIGARAAMCPEVWKGASLHHFVSCDQYVIYGDKYIPFFRRCIHHGNTSSMLLKGLRRSFNEGDVGSAIPLIRSSGMQHELDYFLVGILHMMAGNYMNGMRTINKICWWEDIEQLNVLGSLALTFVHNLNFRRVQTFESTAEILMPRSKCCGDDFGKCVWCILPFWALQFVSIS